MKINSPLPIQADQPTEPRTSLRYRLVSATMAGLLWGTWAFWVNSHTAATMDESAVWKAGIIQAAGSFLITLLMVRLVSWLFLRVPPSTRLFLPALLTVLVTGSCLAAAHVVAGTPEILRTIAPALSVAMAFNMYTAFTLKRTNSTYPGYEKKAWRHG